MNGWSQDGSCKFRQEVLSSDLIPADVGRIQAKGRKDLMLGTGEQPDLPGHLSENHGEILPECLLNQAFNSMFLIPATTLPGQKCSLHFIKGYGL